MIQYPTPADLHYGDVADTTLPQGGSQWGSGRPDTSQSAVNADADDRQRAQQLRASASQSLPPNFTPATAYTSRDSYPAQTQSHSAQYGYPSQPYTSGVNYVEPPYDFGEYPVSLSRPPLCDPDRVFTDPIIRAMRSTPTSVDPIPLMQLIPSILLLIPCLSIHPSMLGTSPRTATSAPRSRVNTSTT